MKKSIVESFEDFHKASAKFWNAVFETLKIVNLVEWLNKKLGG